jgi:hypothetical protein
MPPFYDLKKYIFQEIWAEFQKIALEFQSAGFHTFQTCQYLKAVFKY